MSEQARPNKWHRDYSNGAGLVEQFGPKSYIGSFTPFYPSAGTAPTVTCPRLSDAQEAVDEFSGERPTGEWRADKLNT